MQKNEQHTYESAAETLKKARQLLGMSRGRIAARMGVPENVWVKYETGAVRIPKSLMLKIFVFGLDNTGERDW